VKYEKTAYPNCQGDAVELNIENNTFRAQELVLNSYPNPGEAPYQIDYVTVLPSVT
jgi:hypothetical protein